MNAKAAEAAEKKAKAAEAAAKKKAAAEEEVGGESAPLPKGYVPASRRSTARRSRPSSSRSSRYDSSMQVPRFVKVIVSMGVGEAKENKKILDAAVEDLAQITGQHAVKTKAQEVHRDLQDPAGAGDRRAGSPFAGPMMWEFLDRLMNVALPRVKDFRGVNPNAFDGHGNYSLGLTEQIIFPEIDFDKIEKIMGLNIAIVTTARNDKEAKSLLAKMGMPFRK